MDTNSSPSRIAFYKKLAIAYRIAAKHCPPKCKARKLDKARRLERIIRSLEKSLV